MSGSGNKNRKHILYLDLSTPSMPHSHSILPPSVHSRWSSFFAFLLQPRDQDGDGFVHSYWLLCHLLLLLHLKPNPFPFISSASFGWWINGSSFSQKALLLIKKYFLYFLIYNSLLVTLASFAKSLNSL